MPEPTERSKWPLVSVLEALLAWPVASFKRALAGVDDDWDTRDPLLTDY